MNGPHGPHGARSPSRMLASVRIYSSPRMCLHLSPSAARSPGRVLASVRIDSSPSMCLHLSPSAARLPGHMLASVRICLSPSMCLHLSPSAACSPGRARQCAHLLVSQYVPVLPDGQGAACLPVSQYVPSFVSQCCQIARAGKLTCLPVCAFVCLPVLPDRRAVCSQCARLLVSQYVPSFVSQRCLPVRGFACVPVQPDLRAACLPVYLLTGFPACALMASPVCAFICLPVLPDCPGRQVDLSPSMCLRLSPSAGRSPGRMLAVCAFTCLPACAFICLPALSPSAWLCLCPSAARSPGRMLASVFVDWVPSMCLDGEPSMCLHLSPSAARLPDIVCAFICTCLPVLPDCRRPRACLPVRAFMCFADLTDRRAVCRPVECIIVRSTLVHFNKQDGGQTWGFLSSPCSVIGSCSD